MKGRRAEVILGIGILSGVHLSRIREPGGDIIFEMVGVRSVGQRRPLLFFPLLSGRGHGGFGRRVDGFSGR